MLCGWFIILLVAHASAQITTPRFRHITIDEGLSQSAVYALLQDREGFIWVGTKDGLNRYDGINFKIFRHNPLDSSSLSNNYITELYQDRDGYIWVGTAGGLDRLDPVSGLFKHYEASETNSTPGNIRISAIGEDRFGHIWVGTKTGLYLLTDKNRPRFTVFHANVGDTLSISHNTIRKIMTDRNGQTWFATFGGISRLLTDSVGSVRGFRNYYPHLPLSGNPTDYEVVSMFEDDRGLFWLGNIRGLTRFNPHNGRFRIFTHGYSQDRDGWGSVYGLIQGPGAAIWSVTSIGLMLFDTTKQTYRKLTHLPNVPFSLNNSQLTRIMRDRSGVIWIGTNGYGLNVFNPRNERFKLYRRPADFKSYIDRFSVSALLKSRDGQLWISADVLYVLDMKSGRLHSFETDPKHPVDFGNAGASSLMEDDRGNIWLAGYEGVYRYTISTQQTRHFSRASGLKEKVAYKLLQSRDKFIWIVTASWLTRYNPRRGTFRHYPFKTPKVRNFTPITAIVEDRASNLWLATDNGLIRFDPKTEVFTYYRHKENFRTGLGANMILSLTVDPVRPGRLWLGTSGLGLARFDADSDSLILFNESDGLPNNVVYAALPDREGNFWLSTNRGLCRFNPATLETENFDVNDGLQSNEFNTGAYFVAKDGEMFFGGIKGLNYFYPRDIHKNPYKPPTIITGLRIFNNPVSNKNNPLILDSLITVKRHLHLTYRENIFSLEFSALDYSAPQRNRYAYRMLGFNNNWIQAGNQRFATFTNLPAGRYTFQVRGANSDGLWNEHPRSLIISVRPPIYKTWWAYSLYVLIFGLFLWGVRQYEMKRIVLKNRLNMKEIEGEKLRELSVLKSRFFANISHEFRTPLTLILGPIETLKQKIHGKTSLNLLDIMQRNADRLLQLINQLLDLAKLDSGKMEIHLRQGDIVAFLRGIISSYDTLAQNKNIRFTFSSESPGHLVLFDHEKVENIFHNLISNALKFTPGNGWVSVVVRFIEESNKQRHIQVVVSDSGPGIPVEKSAFIFDRFYQADDSDRGKGGSGIGLALVKEMVELQNGHLVYNPGKQGGAVFTVTLPCSNSDLIFTSSETSQDVEDDEKAPIEAKSESRSLVLVIDDNEDMRMFIRSILDEKFEILEADNGITGKKKAMESIPDLVISDVMMPEMEGNTLCRILKNDEKTSHIPIILLTARAGSADKISGLQSGADDYLVKPFHSDELCARVNNLIEMRQKLIEGLDQKTFLTEMALEYTDLDKNFLHKIRKTVEEQMADENFGPNTLCRVMNMSERQLRRKLKSLTGQTPNQIIRSMRLEKARFLLQKKHASVAEVAFLVGFSSPAYFTKTFREEFGILPSHL